MKRYAWFGALAVFAIVMGLMSRSGITPALAAGSGPTINITASPNVAFVGSTVTVDLATAAPAGPDMYKGYNASIVYSSSTLGGSMTAVSATDKSVASGFWAADFCPPPSLTNNFAGSLPVPLLGAILGCTSLPVSPTLALGLMTEYKFTAAATGVTAFHMVTQTEAGLGANSFSTYTINNDGTSTRQANPFFCTGGAQFPTGNCGAIVIAAPDGLAAAMAGGDLTATVGVDPTTLGFPLAGTVQIGSEFIYYSSHSATQLLGLTRGVCNTTAAAHAAGSPVLAIFSASAPPTTACSQPWDYVIVVVQPPPVLTVTKTGPASIVAGQPISFQLTVANSLLPATTATNVTVTDTLSAAYPGGANVSFAGSTFDSCLIALQVITCTKATLAPGASATVTVNLLVTLATVSGTQQNCAIANAANDPPPVGAIPPSLQVQSCINVQFIPPAVAWHKASTCGNGNVWLAENNNPTQSVGQCVGTRTFDEVMTNQGDKAGLGGFSFDLHWDPTQFIPPVIDMTPAIQLFCDGTSPPGTGIVTNGVCTTPGTNGRKLSCSISIPFNGVIHEACASTGTFATGPQWAGDKVMAHVTLTLQDLLREAIRPNKENGDVSTVKDDQVTVTNSCGQPLNDETQGSTSIPPSFQTPGVPPNPDCQGVRLQGVGPGGVLVGNPNGGQLTSTFRRLEGDVTKDCSVDISDMQLEASKFGTSLGNLLYGVFFDVNEPTQHGDGEIDINDVQFVFGRMGSECSLPIPPQPPAPPTP